MPLGPPAALPAPAPHPPGPLALLFRLALGLIALAVPLTAVWLLTTLARSLGLTLPFALAVGILLPLGLPVLWDLWAEARYRSRQTPTPRLLARSDRLRLRVLALCLLTLGVPVLALGSQTASAIAQHGAWFMGSSSTPFAAEVRENMVNIATTLVTLDSQPPALRPASLAAPVTAASRLPPPAAAADPLPWPLPDEPHPTVRAMTDADAADLDAIAHYIGAREADPFQRVKAIHDVVVRWIALDTATLGVTTPPPPQDAAATWARRTATSEGFVQVMVALGERLGLALTPITGRSRVLGAELSGFAHTWVGLELAGARYLIDPTWDAGVIAGRTFTARYSTAYLFTPPPIFANDHLPDDPSWSLLDPPLTPERFIDRPALSASFFARGLGLDGVARGTVEAHGSIHFSVQNPRRQWVLVTARPLGDGRAFNCVVPTDADPVQASCPLTPGAWEIGLYASPKDRGSFPALGYFRVTAY